ncbi:MAG: helix-turn-helix transcriptional regulator [Halothiobacillaceae bacterium]
MAASPSSALESAFLILAILRRIPRRRFTTCADIQSALESEGYARDIRSIQRYLDAICTHFPVECDTRGKPYGYRWRNEAHGLGLPMLTPSEALLLHLASAELSEMLPAHVLSSLKPLLGSALWQLELDPKAAPARQWLRKVRRIPARQPLLPPKLQPGILENISEALFHERKLDIRYRNAQGETRERIVWPLGLGQQGVRLYLVCRFEGYDNQRILALPRIEYANVRMETFDYPEDFDLERYNGEGGFAFGDGQKVRLHFFIDKTIGLHLTESPLSSDQSVIEHDNALEISATVMDSALLHQWIKGWGDSIWNVNINSTEKHYSKDNTHESN